MTMQSREEDGAPEENIGPLVTRNVFIDTQTYREVEFDTRHPTLTALFEHIGTDTLRLHTTDITLRECLRHVGALTEGLARELGKTAGLATKWRGRIPANAQEMPEVPTGIDHSAWSKTYFGAFRTALKTHGAREHAAASQDPVPIFRAYFDRHPPFDEKKKPKEFPDAFVIAALVKWCEDNDTSMYVVTRDGGMRRAALASGRLVPLETLAELLSSATREHSPDVEAAVDLMVGASTFAEELAGLVDEHLGDVGIVYYGDLADGDIESAQAAGDAKEIGWTVISAAADRYGVIVDFVQPILAQVDFEDRELAFYDKEDDSYFGAESATAELEADVEVRMFVEITASGEVVRSEMLGGDLDFHDPTGPY